VSRGDASIRTQCRYASRASSIDRQRGRNAIALNLVLLFHGPVACQIAADSGQEKHIGRGNAGGRSSGIRRARLPVPLAFPRNSRNPRNPRLLATLHFPASLCSLFNAARARAGHNKKSVKDLESYELCTMGLSIARCKYSHFR